MVDELREVTSKGWFERISESIKGVLVGLAMFVIAFPLLWWNEGRSVQTYKSLQEGRGAVVSVPADVVDTANEGKLVHTSGTATTDETLTDSVFGVSANALRLSRDVEMYQWVEKVDSKTTKKAGGGEETEKTYSYSREWSSRPVSSADFRQPKGHENPADMRFSSATWSASRVTLGAFDLSDGLKSSISRSVPIPATNEILKGSSEEVRRQARVQGDGLYVGTDPANPAVGDLRIAFSKVPPAEVSVVARQSGDGLGPYQTEAGDRLEMLQAGNVPADQMFSAAEHANVFMTWVLRAVGFLVMLFGLMAIFRPLSVVADVVPLIGDLVGMGTGLVAFAVAAPLSLVTIAFAWIYYRPLLGIALLVVAVGVFIGLKQMAAKRQLARAPAAA